jgi:hypothetical protein
MTVTLQTYPHLLGLLKAFCPQQESPGFMALLAHENHFYALIWLLRFRKEHHGLDVV